MDDDFKFGVADWMGQTTLHPVGVVAILVLGMAMLIAPRRYAVIPMIIMACLVAGAQRIVLLTLNLHFIRLMVLFGWLRILTRGETRGFTWKPIDVMVVLWIASGTITYIALYGTGEAVKFSLGWAFDGIGLYFLFRCLIHDWRDIGTITFGFILVSIPVALAFLVEHTTARNVFAFFGGVPEITEPRDGRLRCQGAFAHPILAGCFWAVVVPLIVARWWQGGSQRKWVVIGLVTTSTVIVMCASSLPVGGVICAALGGCAFLARYHMRALRWTIVIVLVALHLVMNKPVWHLLARIDLAGGSTGWHRYWLIDLAIQNVSDWWLIGTTHVNRWQTLFAALDVTNQYLWEGINGGIIPLGFFIAVIVCGFRGVGALLRTPGLGRDQVITAWALGVSLFVHVMNFIGVSYFGQITMLWFLSIAMIGSLTPAAESARAGWSNRRGFPRVRAALRRTETPRSYRALPRGASA